MSKKRRGVEESGRPRQPHKLEIAGSNPAAPISEPSLTHRLEAAARLVAEPAQSAIREAIAEIAALRRALNGRDEALKSAIGLMQDYAYKSGWYEAGYVAIEKRYADPTKVAKTCVARFKEEK